MGQATCQRSLPLLSSLQVRVRPDASVAVWPSRDFLQNRPFTGTPTSGGLVAGTAVVLVFGAFVVAVVLAALVVAVVLGALVVAVVFGALVVAVTLGALVVAVTFGALVVFGVFLEVLVTLAAVVGAAAAAPVAVQR